MENLETFDPIDVQYIRRCFYLAQKGRGRVSPNPLVGAVVVRDNIILGEGYHQKYGGPHAEVNAISSAKSPVSGATLYCNLEPCCHRNKQTPPCTDLIINSGIKRVVISTIDPNPLVFGEGVKILKNAKIEVLTGVLAREGGLLNEAFFSAIQNQRPFLHLKLAQTLDGKMATIKGDSKWISDDDARREVHQLRSRYDAIMIGRRTLNNDNPALTVRMGVEILGEIPYRIIMGSLELMNPESKVFNDEVAHRTIVVTTVDSYQETPTAFIDHLKNRNVEIIFAGIKKDQFSLDEALKRLGEKKIGSILVEGGPTLIQGLMAKRKYDKVTIYVAPKLLGEGVEYFKQRCQFMEEASSFARTRVRTINNQAVFEGYRE